MQLEHMTARALAKVLGLQEHPAYTSRQGSPTALGKGMYVLNATRHLVE